MKCTLVTSLIVLASISTARPGAAQTAVSVNARIGDFHVAVANHYHVPEREVIVLRDRRISDDELPVVLFIAREARVPVSRVLALRHRGRSWWDISVTFGLRPDVYYVPVLVDPGPPYGRAHGHYKKPRREWDRIVLSDADLMHLVHVRFLSEHYGVRPDDVLQARGRHRTLVAAYSDIGQQRSGKGDRKESGSGRGNGKGKGNGTKR